MSYRSPRFSTIDRVLPTPTLPDARLRFASRLLAAGAGILGLALMIAVRGLEPDPRGYGTHEQLGLSPCLLQQWTGRVCPACGTTTAWAHALRGDIRQAAAANLGGTLLCAVALVGAPWLLISAIAGRWLLVRPTLPWVLTAGTVWLAVTLLDWLWRWYFG